ncbi:MAG: LPXTG cell wall anchor domain-containing protein [Saccharofermentanales bacterium]
MVDKSNYEAKEGSTIVTFKPSFLETLSVGKHPVEIVSASGSGHGTVSAHGTIEIKAQVDPKEVQVTKSNDSTTKSSDATPKTGENSGIYLWSSFIFVAAGGILLALLKKKSRQRD